MEEGGPKYLTRMFQEAAALPRHEQLQFLSRLPESRFFKPDSNNNTFRDVAAFCLDISEVDIGNFSANLHVPPSLFGKWMEGKHFPYPLPRVAYARTMIENALHANGWIGYPPMPPVLDGSNVFSLRPRSP